MPILRAASILAAIVLAACVFGDDRNHGRPDGNTSERPDAPKDIIDAEPPPPDAAECTPHEELCNGLDDDCDDERDEDWPVGQHCTVPTACPPDGMYVCRGDGAGVVCMAGGGGPEPELCEDGVDNDCMGGDANCPANDAPAGAIDVSAGGTFNVNLEAAHDNVDASCGGAGGRDVFYEITVPSAEVVYLDTLGSNFDSVIHVHDGACAASLGTEEVCDDDECGGEREQGAWQLSAGTHCIVIEQYDDNETNGNVRLVVTRGRRPGTKLTNLIGSATGSTTGGVDRSSPSAGCTDASTAPDVAAFFLVCPGETRNVRADTCDTTTTFDTVLYARRGDGSGPGGALACDDDDPMCTGATTRSNIAFTITTPGLYWLIVDGWMSQSGAFELFYDLQ